MRGPLRPDAPAVSHPEDWPGRPAVDLGEPGSYPFARGPYAGMYTRRPWTMRQYAGFGTAAATNERFRALLAAGQTGLSTAFDLPTQMGYDSDHPMAAGEVGRVGVAIDTVDDLARLFDGIPLDRVTTSMTINATAAILLAMYIVVGEEHGVPLAALGGTVQNDILKEYVSRGTYIYPAEPSLRLTTDLFRFVAAQRMNFNPISISGYHMREAGATAVQEVGFTLANAMEYVRRGIAAGVPLDAFAPRLSFFFAAHNNLFEEAAKFRAARRLFARLMRERFGADDASARLRFHTQTGGVTLQAQQPMNNVVRVTVQALAAVLGGTQSLHTNAYDEALALPSEASATLALRTQQILAFESGMTETVDPLAGSWYVEALTDRIEAGARALVERSRGRWRGRGGDRAGILPTRDRRQRLGDATGAGSGGRGGGRRQSIHRRFRGSGACATRLCRAGAHPAWTSGGSARSARCGAGHGGARRGSCRRRRVRHADAGDHRCRARARDAGRNQ